MHAPLIFAVYIYLHQKHREEKNLAVQNAAMVIPGGLRPG
jgi:hypothetical protein